MYELLHMNSVVLHGNSLGGSNGFVSCSYPLKRVPWCLLLELSLIKLPWSTGAKAIWRKFRLC